MAVMELIEAFWFDEHLITLEQPMDSGLAGLRTLLAFEFGRVAG